MKIRRRSVAMGLALVALWGTAWSSACWDDGVRLRRESLPAAGSSPEVDADVAVAAGARAGLPARFLWQLPDGWSALEPTRMRLANLLAGDDVACTLVELPGASGSLRANVKRWHGEMGVPLPSEHDLANAPRHRLLGRDALLIDLRGTYRPIQGAPRADARLVGVAAEGSNSSVFVKLVGPATAVARELERFERFVDSIERSPDAPVRLPGAGAEGLRWDRPADWMLAPARPMRLATFLPGGSDELDVSLSLLPGTAGGPQANFNRWRGQMGREPLSREEIAELPTMGVLGVQAPWIEVAGEFQGMSGEPLPAAALLGFVVSLGDDTLFLKLTGPAERVRSLRDEFFAFARSLRFEQDAP